MYLADRHLHTSKLPGACPKRLAENKRAVSLGQPPSIIPTIRFGGTVQSGPDNKEVPVEGGPPALPHPAAGRTETARGPISRPSWAFTSARHPSPHAGRSPSGERPTFWTQTVSGPWRVSTRLAPSGRAPGPRRGSLSSRPATCHEEFGRSFRRGLAPSSPLVPHCRLVEDKTNRGPIVQLPACPPPDRPERCLAAGEETPADQTIGIWTRDSVLFSRVFVESPKERETQANAVR